MDEVDEEGKNLRMNEVRKEEVIEVFYLALNPHSAFDPIQARLWKECEQGRSVECVPARDVEVNELGVWLPGRLLNVSLMMCKGSKLAYL
jgi:hypothetical protein